MEATAKAKRVVTRARATATVKTEMKLMKARMTKRITKKNWRKTSEKRTISL